MKEKQSKKVLLINVTCGFGSTGRIVTGIYDELTRRGYTCKVAYGRNYAPKGYDAYRIGTEFDVNVHGVLSRITDRHGFYSKKATKELIEEIKEFDPDIIHLHNLHGYYLDVDGLFKYLRESKKQIIWTLHDCWTFTGHCTHFEFAGCNRWKEECGKCVQLREYPKSLVFDSSKKNLSQKRELFSGIPGMKLVTPSKWLKEKVENSFMGEYPVAVVPTGIDTEVFRPSVSDLKTKYGIKNKFVILGAANPWRERKGYDEFIKLSEKISDKYAIVMIGLKDKQIKVLSGKNIIALKRTDSIQEMAAWYSAADAYVNLTFEDTFPTTNIEALSCGTPVVTYRVGGSPESLTTDCGFIIDPSDIDGVINALEKIRKGKDMTEKCLERASLYSAPKRFAQYYCEVYEPLGKK